MAQRQLRIALLAAMGLCLAAAAIGLLWPWVGNPHLVWSKRQADEYQAAAHEFHMAIDDHGKNRRTDGSHAEHENPQALQAARQRFDRIKGELERARVAQRDLGSWLLRLGLAGAALFGIGYGTMRT